MREADLIVAGQVVQQPGRDRSVNDFPGGLNDRTPFKVLVQRVLMGVVSKDAPITVGVVRNEKEFRYPLGQPLIFFLKKGEGIPGASYSQINCSWSGSLKISKPRRSMTAVILCRTERRRKNDGLSQKQQKQRVTSAAVCLQILRMTLVAQETHALPHA